MKVYMAICNTADPEIENSSRTNMLGVFSSKELAYEAFERKENRFDKDGTEWEAYHTCFQGIHTVEEFEIDKWYPLGKY